MAIDKVVDSAVLDGYFTDIADAIRAKAETTDTYSPADMPQAIADIPAGGDTLDEVLLSKTATEYINDTFDGAIRNSLFGVFGVNNNTLERVSIPNAIQIDGYAFYQCKALEEVDLPEVQTFGGQYAFTYCTALKEVSFPKCTRLAGYDFQGCTSLKKVSFPLVTALNSYSFSGCSALEEVNMPELTGQLNMNTFPRCTSLENVEFPKLTGIQTGVFSGCTNLTVVDIGRAYTGGRQAPRSIANTTFDNTNLTALVLRNTNSIHTLSNTGTFANTPIASGTGYIYVPRDLVATYQAATNWSTYASQIRAIEDYTVDGTLTGDFVLPV